jgi:hypothetical protein
VVLNAPATWGCRSRPQDCRFRALLLRQGGGAFQVWGGVVAGVDLPG